LACPANTHLPCTRSNGVVIANAESSFELLARSTADCLLNLLSTLFIHFFMA
jgi:hypothetical protein